jgi:molybdopterin molybdotransferase
VSDFQTFLMVDWSGGNDRGARPKADAIWAGVIRNGRAEPSVYLRNRQVAEAWLVAFLDAELAAGRRVLAGFDFPFGYPAGFARHLVGRADPLALWDWLGAHLHDGPSGNNRFELADRINAGLPGIGPFWFNASATDLPHLPRKGRDRTADHGLAERRHCEALATGAFSCWQLGGAGAVGSQALTGMASLSRIRARFEGSVAVWPFQTPTAAIVLAEIWPSLFAGEVNAQIGPGDIKDEVQVRHLAAKIADWQKHGQLEAALGAVPDIGRKEEGWILGLGLDSAGLTPPRLKNDCFAMPQGVDWVPVTEALSRLRAALVPVTVQETVPLAAARQRILSQAVTAPRSNPPMPNSAVDGYGFAHAETGSGVQRLPLAEGRAAAGQPFAGAVPAGQAVRILTGAMLPEGVDTVVLEEDCATDGSVVVFDGPLKARSNTRRAGEDVVAGAEILQAGTSLRAPDIALLAAVGLREVAVYRRLRVGVLSTGDEIVRENAAAHQIYDANRPMLLGLAEGWGYEPVDLGHIRDDADLIRQRLDDAALEADVILTSGGASAGDEDHVSRILRSSGTLSSWRIAVKPGRPLALALWQGVPVFGLPGNPVAALVCALIFARPALSLLAGGGWLEPQGFTLPAVFSKRKKAGRREYLRARIAGDGRVECFASEGSGRISGLSWATGLVELPDEAQEIAPGDPVRFLPYAGFGLV